jgi:hypothetical protein
LVDKGMRLKSLQGLTVYGGEFRTNLLPSDVTGRSKGRAVFDIVGGSGVTFEAMHIEGSNPGGYHPKLAFAGGIEFEGTSNPTVRGITISHTFGDGITLGPLRGGAHSDSGQILAPTSSITIRDVTLAGVGRQGVALVSVSGATMEDLVVTDPAINTFDVEADQSNEGAKDVTIDGCLASGGVGFFANGGAGNAVGTGNFTVEHCTMDTVEGGSAILVVRSGHGAHQQLRGPFAFVADDLACGASVYQACLQLKGANVTVTGSRLRFPRGSIHEAVYHLARGSQAQLIDCTVRGYGQVGSADATSVIKVVGGRWTPPYPLN